MYKLFPIVILLLAAAVSAQDIDKMPTITTTGTAEIFVDPDQVTISLNVEKTSMDLQKAKSENDAAMEKIIAETKKFGIEPKDVKTRRISVDMLYEYVQGKDEKILDEYGDEVGRKVFRGYEVSKNIEVLLRDVSKFEAFYSALLETGLTEIGSVTFSTSKLREFKDQARTESMKAAREKASAMAAAVEQRIGKAIRITEGTVGSSYISSGIASNFSANTISQSGSVSETVAEFGPGSISVTANVTVTFALD